MPTIQQDNKEAIKLIKSLEAHRMTQAQIAEALGYKGNGSISRILNGKANVTIDTLNGLRKLAEEYCK